MELNSEFCGVYGCTRRSDHRGTHTPDPPLTTIDWDYNYEHVVVRLVMRAIRAGWIEGDPQHIRAWMARETALGLR